MGKLHRRGVRFFLWTTIPRHHPGSNLDRKKNLRPSRQIFEPVANWICVCSIMSSVKFKSDNEKWNITHGKTLFIFNGKKMGWLDVISNRILLNSKPRFFGSFLQFFTIENHFATLQEQKKSKISNRPGQKKHLLQIAENFINFFFEFNGYQKNSKW